MAEEKNTKKKNEQVSMRRSGYGRVIEACAYFGIGFIAIALVFATCFTGNAPVFTTFKTIGDTIAYILAIILAFYYVRRKKHIAWLICYVVFVVLIVVLYILGAVLPN